MWSFKLPDLAHNRQLRLRQGSDLARLCLLRVGRCPIEGVGALRKGGTADSGRELPPAAFADLVNRCRLTKWFEKFHHQNS
jgi:hypothetical protein